MNGIDRSELTDLTLRLFGEDGQAGALGRIEGMLVVQANRLAALESDKIARDAARHAVATERAGAKADRRWRLTAIISTIGVLLAATAGIANGVATVLHLVP